MSLVNDMLRDLDRRGARHPAELEADPQHQPGRVSRFAAEFRPAWLWLLIGVVLGSGALALVTFKPSSSSGNPDGSNQTGVQFLVPEIELAPESGPQGLEVDSVAAEALAQVQSKRQLDQALSQQPMPPDHELDGRLSNTQTDTLSQLLEQAGRARSADRLTRPAGDSAYDYYQQVLAIDPGHPAAQSGLIAIARRYTEMAETALDSGNLIQARQFIRRGLSVEPSHLGLQRSEERLENLVATRQGGDHDRAVAIQSDTEVPEDQEQAAAAPEPQMRMNLDAETWDWRAAREGRELMQRGDLVAARQYLQSSLRAWTEPNLPPVQTTQALTDLYLREGDYALVETLLQASQALPKGVLHRLWAQLEQARGRPQAAIDWLEAELGSAREDEHYRSLLARLYYTQGQQDQAAQSYSRLLADFGGRPAYWLGLGLARDAQDQNSAALEAFRRAQASQAYERNPEIAEYLKRRIAALQRQTQTSEP